MSFFKDLGTGFADVVSGGVYSKRANRDKMYKDMVKQTKEFNLNLEKASEKTHGLAAAEGVNQQAAYAWASNMMRKHRDNPAMLEQTASLADNRLRASSDNSLRLKAAAVDMLTKRLAKPVKERVSIYQDMFQSLSDQVNVAASAASLFGGGGK